MVHRVAHDQAAGGLDEALARFQERLARDAADPQAGAAAVGLPSPASSLGKSASRSIPATAAAGSGAGSTMAGAAILSHREVGRLDLGRDLELGPPDGPHGHGGTEPVGVPDDPGRQNAPSGSSRHEEPVLVELLSLLGDP